jgi:hypothetical protein
MEPIKTPKKCQREEHEYEQEQKHYERPYESSLLERCGRDSFLIIRRVGRACQARGRKVRILHHREREYQRSEESTPGGRNDSARGFFAALSMTAQIALYRLPQL